MVEENLISIDEWFAKVTEIHSTPCYLMIKLDEQGKLTLIGVAGDPKILTDVINVKESMTYIG